MTQPAAFELAAVRVRSRSALALLSLLLLCAAPLQAQHDALSTDPRDGRQEIDSPTAETPSPDTHASRQAPVELLTLAGREPGAFIGKTLILHDGINRKTVGPVKDLRKRLQDEQLYLIVDAAAYFNTPVDYAVAVRDLDRIEGEELIIPETSGMHLNGLDYYPADYADVEVLVPTAATPADE